MKRLELRVPVKLTDRLLSAIDSADGVERVAFGLVSHSSSPGRELLLLREVLPVRPDSYLAPGLHGAKWSGQFTVEVLNRAARQTLGIVILHEHRLGRPVRLSPDDRESGAEQLGAFGRLIPERPHATVVVGADSAAALVSFQGELLQPEAFCLRLLGGNIEDRASTPHVEASEEREAFARQLLLVGGEGQRRLGGTTVAVVGLCGGGSHAIQQLAHLGVGRILGIDDDVCSESNRSRMVGVTEQAVRERWPKTRVSAEVVNRIGLGSEFVPVQSRVPSNEAVAAILSADVVLGCVDNLHARADLQTLAWRHLIPYVDIGLRIEEGYRENRALARSWIGGQIMTLVPGSACMWCMGYLSDTKLRSELGGRERSYLGQTPGTGQVVSLNGVLASQATTEVLRLLTGFAEVERGTRRLSFNGVSGSLEHWSLERSAACSHCENELAAGSPVWRSAG
ncbi:MAG: ThiF family adenylyltransferase [Candidatus Eisenbacteria bacterium]|nr:ThiF family adenylyltransferase [Candidatus Eisenbacteria bacterium]